MVKNDNPLTKRLGILVTGTNKAIDVPQRRFIQVNIGDEDGFSAYPARKTRTRHNINYFSLDGKATLTTPESYIKDIYFRAIYSRELIEQFLI